VPLAKAGSLCLKWLSDHVTNKPPMSTPPEIEYSSQHLYFDNSKARQELGLEFMPVESSVRESIQWFRDHGYA